ncbi:MAG: magnesium/cobalt efflux protein, partial [Pseudomonadota bacterium]|nr:magnesium/cobalt efflux protein [Pseudomonadota bacterium]
MSDPDPSHANNGQSSNGADAPRHTSFLKRLSQVLRGESGTKSIRESLEEVIEESERSSDAALLPQERMMLANLLRFGELRVDDVMVPRADIVAVEESTSLCDLVNIFREA